MKESQYLPWVGTAEPLHNATSQIETNVAAKHIFLLDVTTLPRNSLCKYRNAKTIFSSKAYRLLTCPQQIPDLYIKAPRSWHSVYTRSPNLLNSCLANPDGLRCRCPAHLFRDEH